MAWARLSSNVLQYISGHISHQRIIAIAALTIICGSFFARPALADYRLCNETSYVLEAAIATQDRGGWETQGWLRIDPGDCAVALPGPVSHGPYFLFAQTHRAHAGAQREFSGSTPFCTVSDDFLIEGRHFCALRGYDSRDFYRVTVKPGKDWITSFTGGGYSLPMARIAGVERLLAELGLGEDRVDGRLSPPTENAIRTFRKVHSIPGNPTDIDAALYDTLLNAADAKNGGQGLSLCNETMELIWAAVGREYEGSARSIGWFEVQSGECTQAVRGSLPSKAVYYLYGESSPMGGKKRSWFGKYQFCTRKTRFSIEGKTQCETRNAAQTGFMRLDTGGRTSYSYTMK